MLSETEYEEAYNASLQDPIGFWSKAAADVVWYKKWDSVCDLTNPINPKWFEGGELNACYNCLDRHVENGKADEIILYHRSSLTKQDKNITYGYLLEQVSKLAAVLSYHDVKKNDTVVIVMPNIPEVIIAMMACARLGAVHCVFYGGLSERDMAHQLEFCEPKVLIASAVGMVDDEVVNYKEKIEAAISQCKNQPKHCIYLCRNQQKSLLLKEGRDLIWEDVIDKYGTHDCVSVPSCHPLFYTFTSGSTGNPKVCVYECGPSLVRYRKGRTNKNTSSPLYFPANNIGWLGGHVSLCYYPLLNQDKTVLFEGDLLEELYKIIEDYKVTVFTWTCSTFRELRNKDPEGKLAAKYNLDSIKIFGLGGECVDKKTMEYCSKTFGVVVLNAWGQTEANICLATFFSRKQILKEKVLLYPRPVMGIKLVAFKDDGTEAAVGEVGTLAVKLPCPPGWAATLLKNHTTFLKKYFSKFPGYFNTNDEGFINEDGSVFVTGRTDNVLKIGPYRIAESNIEEVILQHPDVINCVVVGAPHNIKGEAPLALIIVRTDKEVLPNIVKEEVHKLVVEKIGKNVYFQGSVCVKQLPKTLSGKIHKKYIRDILHNKLKPGLPGPQQAILDDILYAVTSSGILSFFPI